MQDFENNFPGFWDIHSNQMMNPNEAQDRYRPGQLFFEAAKHSTLKVMGNHVVHDYAAKGNHSKHALCFLPSMKKQKHDFHYHFFFVQACT